MNIHTPVDFKSFFKDKNGKIVLWQVPNIFLSGWLIFKMISLLQWSEQYKNGFQQLSTSLLLAWAVLEVTKGVNYFRKTLGLIVLAITVLSIFK